MELTHEQLMQQVELNNQLVANVKQFQEITSKMYDVRTETFECRNVDLYSLQRIYSKYKESEVLNCYGDIFYIVKELHNGYIGKRILWNLGLSEEKYLILKDVDYDDDGEYNYTEYEIQLYKED